MESRLLLALKCTLNNTWFKQRNLCSHCPFGYGYKIETQSNSEDPAENDTTWTCDDLKIFDDVYKWLAANTQHQLTAEEVREKAQQKAPFWFENLSGSRLQNGWKLSSTVPALKNEIYVCDLERKGLFLSLKQYGKTWRAWAQPLEKENNT